MTQLANSPRGRVIKRVVRAAKPDALYPTIDAGMIAMRSYLTNRLPQTLQEIRRGLGLKTYQVYAQGTQLRHFMSMAVKQGVVHAVYRGDAPCRKLYSVTPADGQQYLPFHEKPAAAKAPQIPRIADYIPDAAPAAPAARGRGSTAPESLDALVATTPPAPARAISLAEIEGWVDDLRAARERGTSLDVSIAAAEEMLERLLGDRRAVEDEVQLLEARLTGRAGGAS